MADELHDLVVSEAVFLKPKAYSISFVASNSVNMKQSAKGVTSSVKS